MRAAAVAFTMLLLQGVYDRSNEVDAVPEHFRFQRMLQVPPASQGQTCAVVDAAVYAHTDGRLSALRIYSDGHEVPFALTESGEAGQQEEPARVMNLGKQEKTIVFDLAMPQRTYTDVVLDLDGKDFYATAKVSGAAQHGAPRTDLGQFALFDLRSRGLSRSTTLPLQESTFAVLHVEMTFEPAPGSETKTFNPEIVRGASVPPSREAQILYTTIASTSVTQQEGKSTVARLRVPAHVPVERARIFIDPGFHHDFLRAVTITGKPDVPDGVGAEEAIDGEIERLQRPADAEGLPAINSQQLSIDALLGANLRQAAIVTVAVKNGDDAPLPLREVDLQMRERKVCFDANAGAEYVLRYGDPAPVRAPVYDYARLFRASPIAISATLSTEASNPQFHKETHQRSYTDRHPELLWVALLLVIGVLGAVALHNARRVGQSR